jgi:hypothetical protein
LGNFAIVPQKDLVLLTATANLKNQRLGLAHFVRLTRAERPGKVRWAFRSEEPGGALAFSMRIQRLGLAHFVRLTQPSRGPNAKPQPSVAVFCFFI